MKTLYLCGAGNPEGVRLALTVNAAENRWDRILLLDDDLSKHGQSILGVTVAGSFELLELAGEDDQAVSLVARSTAGRAASRERIRGYGVPLTPLVHPGVDVHGVELEGDVTVYGNGVVSACSRVGAGSVVFTGAVVGHGATVGRNCVLAPGAVTNARVVVEDCAYLGSNCSVLPELTVGASSTVAAGSAVIEDVAEARTVVGVPAEVLGGSFGQEARRANSEPSSDRIETMTTIWCELLELADVGPRENFFEVGGTSRLALELLVMIKERTGVELAITDVFRFATVHELANHMDNLSTRQSSSPKSGLGSVARNRAAARLARRSA